MQYTLCMFKDCSNISTNNFSEYGTYCFLHSNSTLEPRKNTDNIMNKLSSVTISMGNLNNKNESVQMYSSSLPEKKVKSKVRNTPVVLDRKNKNYSIHETMECCICEERTPITDKMKCGHLLCLECLDHIRSFFCPVCRDELEGPLLTDEILTEIDIKYREDMEIRGCEDQTMAYLASLGYNPNSLY